MLKFGKNIREVTGNEFYSNSMNRGGLSLISLWKLLSHTLRSIEKAIQGQDSYFLWL